MNFINKSEVIKIYSKKFLFGKPYLDVYQNNIISKTCKLDYDIPNHSELNVSNGIILGLHDKTIIDLQIPDSIIVDDEEIKIISIASNSFMNSQIKCIDFNNITSIGSFAFAFSHLTSIVFNEKLETIDNNCFRNCTSLKNITFDKNIKTIGYNAFFMCTSLETITIINHDYNHKIVFEEDAFAFCPNLRIIIFTEDNDYSYLDSINLEYINIFYKNKNKNKWGYQLISYDQLYLYLDNIDRIISHMN
jgi:hypothetical protein